MNCFVMMPFAAEFDDVYAVIKTTVEGITTETRGRCFRLDESRPAGRITDRLLSELRSATICIADLTENKPNVMWELGFAMALGKPTILVTQNLATLPFDIKDMQSIEYNRHHLSATLGAPLRSSLLDTLGTFSTGTPTPVSTDATMVGTLLSEVAQLKHMVAEAVSAWKSDDSNSTRASQLELHALTGHWFNTESGSNMYSQIVRGELVSSYCFGGDTDLTGVYFGWRRTGEYWFARYQWADLDISGFTFLRMESLEQMIGAWWSSAQESHGEETPPRSAGAPACWVKKSGTPTPRWAQELFQEVEREGLASWLAKQR